MINDLLRLHLIIMQLVKPKNVKMVVQQNGEGVVVMMTSQRGTYLLTNLIIRVSGCKQILSKLPDQIKTCYCFSNKEGALLHLI